MIICSTRDNSIAPGFDSCGQNFGILNDLLDIYFILRLERLAETNGFGSNDVDQGPPLCAWENQLIKVFGKSFSAKNQASSRTTKRLVGCAGHKIAKRNGTWMLAYGHESSDVGDIGHHEGTTRSRNIRDALEVDNTWVSTGPDHEHFRFMLA